MKLNCCETTVLEVEVATRLTEHSNTHKLALSTPTSCHNWCSPLARTGSILSKFVRHRAFPSCVQHKDRKPAVREHVSVKILAVRTIKAPPHTQSAVLRNRSLIPQTCTTFDRSPFQFWMETITTQIRYNSTVQDKSITIGNRDSKKPKYSVTITCSKWDSSGFKCRHGKKHSTVSILDFI